MGDLYHFQIKIKRNIELESSKIETEKPLEANPKARDEMKSAPTNKIKMTHYTKYTFDHIFQLLLFKHIPSFPFLPSTLTLPFSLTPSSFLPLQWKKTIPLKSLISLRTLFFVFFPTIPPPIPALLPLISKNLFAMQFAFSLAV